jgi:hypothetical protein
MLPVGQAEFTCYVGSLQTGLPEIPAMWICSHVSRPGLAIADENTKITIISHPSCGQSHGILEHT